jgi:hypothetical protein
MTRDAGSAAVPAAKNGKRIEDELAAFTSCPAMPDDQPDAIAAAS